MSRGAGSTSEPKNLFKEVNQHDVMCGRGGLSNKHNVHFRMLVEENKPEYLQARKSEKRIIARKIVKSIHARGGRFIKKVDESLADSLWYEVDEKRALEKTSQALREGLNVRTEAAASASGARVAPVVDSDKKRPLTSGEEGGDVKKRRDDEPPPLAPYVMHPPPQGYGAYPHPAYGYTPHPHGYMSYPPHAPPPHGHAPVYYPYPPHGTPYHPPSHHPYGHPPPGYYPPYGAPSSGMMTGQSMPGASQSHETSDGSPTHSMNPHQQGQQSNAPTYQHHGLPQASQAPNQGSSSQGRVYGGSGANISGSGIKREANMFDPSSIPRPDKDQGEPQLRENLSESRGNGLPLQRPSSTGKEEKNKTTSQIEIKQEPTHAEGELHQDATESLDSPSKLEDSDIRRAVV